MDPLSIAVNYVDNHTSLKYTSEVEISYRIQPRKRRTLIATRTLSYTSNLPGGIREKITLPVRETF